MQHAVEPLNIQGVDRIYMKEGRCMFVLYAYECPILSAYTVQQSRSILSVDFENKMWDKKRTNYNLTLHFPIEAKFWPDNWTVIEWWRMHFWVRLFFFGCTFGSRCSNSFSSCFSLIQEIPSCSCNNNKQGNIYFIFLIVTSLDTMVEYFVDFHLFGVDSVLFHCAFVFECWNWYLPLKRHKRKRKTWK